MGTIAGRAFDCIANRYDELWSTAPAGIYQRRAVWQALGPLFRAGDTVLDLGCGTGVDALFLTANGIAVEGIDASAEMVRIAREKGVRASHLAVEDLWRVGGTFDGAISNFGVLNCVIDLQSVSTSLSRTIRIGGYLVISLIGPFCLWEACHFLRSGQLKKSMRRWRPGISRASLGFDVYYPTMKQVTRAFRPYFRLVAWKGIGVAVPPSYVSGISERTAARLAKIDAALSSWPGFRAISDHRLLIFARV